jgi:GTP-binding protein Era
MSDLNEPTRCGFVALIGAPNAGKSTLLNQLVGAKISIVSRKVQTTRTQVRGIALSGAAQIIFVDTPGIFAPKRRLDRAMVTSAWGGATDADLIGVLIDVARFEHEENTVLLEKLAELKQPKFLILNKIDTVPKEKLLEITAKVNERSTFETTFMVAALTGYGVKDILSWLEKRLPPGPWLYPEDQISDAPLRFLAAEITREKIFERLHDELPYRSTVETESWQQRPDGSVRIEQTIYVERESQRKIVLGEGGQTIKAIGQKARVEITEAAEAKVHLFLFVKVRENWSDDPERYREMGLDFPIGCGVDRCPAKYRRCSPASCTGRTIRSLSPKTVASANGWCASTRRWRGMTTATPCCAKRLAMSGATSRSVHLSTATMATTSAWEMASS